MVAISPKIREKVYIGGLNPPRLSGRDILRRLKSLHQIEIESSSIPCEGNDQDEDDEEECDQDSKPYLHITAISKHESDSALSIIHKQYHNVRWKGCKLVVEVAKPHFLERLEEERRQRRSLLKAREAAAETEIDSGQDKESNLSEDPSRIPRRLRVRKKHGDVAVHIDTKPWTVETWSRFNKARTKLKTREEKHMANALAENKQSNGKSVPSVAPLMHRAVHIRFLDEDKPSASRNGKLPASGNDDEDRGMAVSSSESSSTSISSDSDNDSESESSSGGSIDENKEYEWSDDESASQNSNENIKASEDKLERQLNDEKYAWSTDDESSENEQENHSYSALSREYQQTRKISAADEFATGFESKDIKDFEFSDRSSEGENEDNDSDDLVDDVATNMNILSSIFPEMANTKPVDHGSEHSKLNTENGTQAKKSDSKPRQAIMPRFDPSAKSSRKYIVEDENTEENKGNDSIEDLPSEKNEDVDEMDENESGELDSTEAQNDTTTKLPQESSLYEQDKLENVFRDARHAWGADDARATASSPSTKNTTLDSSSDTKTSSFGFNFNLGDSENSNSQQANESSSSNKAFSFSFNVPGQEDEKKTPVIDGDSTTEQKSSENLQTGALSSAKIDSKEGDDHSVGEKAADHVVERHRGLTLPDKDLQKYVDNFFSCNDGARIMQYPEEFMNDEKDRAAWNAERQTLTLDWKRKRKYAMTRIQKRMKVQRR
jgi:hypothetical protein